MKSDDKPSGTLVSTGKNLLQNSNIVVMMEATKVGSCNNNWDSIIAIPIMAMDNA